MNNPLLQEFKNEFGIPPFDLIKEEHYIPAFDKAIAEHEKEIELIVSNKEFPDFENTINALENSGELLSKVSRVFYNLLSAHSNDNLNKIASEISPRLSRHNDSIYLNQDLFIKIKKVYEDKGLLNAEQQRLIQIIFDNFKLRGSLLDDKKREVLKSINEKLSSLSLKFNQNTLKETNNFKLIISDPADLEGLPEDLVELGKKQAEAEQIKDSWLFKASRENLYPFLTFSNKRSLREKIYKGYISRGKNKNSENNENLIKEMYSLRKQKANLLGFDCHADLALQNSMAETTSNVSDLLNQVWKPAKERADEEIAEMQKLIQKEGNNFKLEAWDWWFYSEKVRKEKYDFSEEDMKPFLSLENIRTAAFTTAERLFDIKFIKLSEFPKYHEEVEAYKVIDSDNNIVGIFLTDYFARPSKQGGAWMTSYRDQSKNNGIKYPIIINVCNFPKPTKNKPSLLNFEHAITLFHEFGHALHGLLSDVTYPSLSGTSVPRDYVEFPSQMMENWIRNPEVLNEFAQHFETGEKIPEDLMNKYLNCQKFNQGFATTEYLAASFLDLAWHTSDKDVTDIGSFEEELFNSINKPKEIDSRYGSTYFNHIFSGGYSSSYYSYMWSEVLDSSAFEVFEKNGIYDKSSGQKLKEYVYSSGNSKDLMEQFIRFNGKEPDPKRLLEKRGLV